MTPTTARIDPIALSVFRLKEGLTKSGLARRAGYSVGYLNDLESGRRGGNAVVIRQLAEALQVPASLLERRAA